MRYVLLGLGLAMAAGTHLAAQQPGANVMVLRHSAAPEAQIQFQYLAADFGGAVVKDAPYSAEAVTETTQTLADGNRIVQKNSATIYRDSQGRTRREQTLGAIGPLAVQSPEPLRLITISDPVVGVSYTLDPQTQTAAKIPLSGAGPVAVGLAGGMSQHATEDVFFTSTPDPQPHPTPGSGAVQTTVFARPTVPAGGTTEQLGKQVIEGVEVEGKRQTTTIPAGQLGNERPIEVTSEQWYSPRLQTVVMSRRSDPRMGETVFRLTNISLNEPPASLFQVPAGYTVKEGPQTIRLERKTTESK